MQTRSRPLRPRRSRSRRTRSRFRIPGRTVRRRSRLALVRRCCRTVSSCGGAIGGPRAAMASDCSTSRVAAPSSPVGSAGSISLTKSGSTGPRVRAWRISSSRGAPRRTARSTSRPGSSRCRSDGSGSPRPGRSSSSIDRTLSPSSRPGATSASRCMAGSRAIASSIARASSTAPARTLVARRRPPVRRPRHGAAVWRRRVFRKRPRIR